MWKQFAIFLALSLAVGCGGGSDTDNSNGNGDASGNASGGGKKYRIAVIPKGTSHEFWKSVHAGAENAARELGNVEILWKGPLQENDREGQISVVQDFITKQVDGICLAPLDSQALVDYVVEAGEADIPVVIFDSGLDGDKKNYVSYVATDNYNGGALAARRLAEVLGKQGDVIMLRYNPGSESTENRERGFLETLEKEFPDINVLSSDEYAGTTPESSLDKATQLLQKHREKVDGIFAVCEPNATGVLGALRDLEMAGKVKFVAFDPNQPLIEGMSGGSVDGIVLQDPVKMGYEAVMALMAQQQGKDVEKRINTGEYVATPQNMDETEMSKLLKPKQFED
ncbi:MAG: substrate-binding domain-containing protein [Planctomycetaceae bacterium]|jgi:ribose transport system substrate-binding protein|nr:substrate-binding domain-containing protein [Planctomycetaceae bacterium]MBT6155731.1 substrate-binding domain-containing protein [Planctomycetaceae bacterium]MBT6485014.1 substrate-binding domain-containing protein [Planctomycetaceae bacterium]MBT6497500.1 substrate-binding domain-containing protein [Planctomycetaceae bacterium]